jgi:hypothetical protein
MLLGVNRKTIAKKLIFISQSCKVKNDRFFKNLSPVCEMQFDDLETIEHTKFKPLSVTMAIENKTRKILGFEVAQMPAKGLLAKEARKKYGFRPDLRGQSREKLFEKLHPKVAENALIQSDQNPHYAEPVKKWFPKAEHRTVLGGRGCIAGQGELKQKKFDPLFTLNHTFAMCRANINRLIRKTWCTTKKPERLRDHLELYVYYHNHVLIQKKAV